MLLVRNSQTIVPNGLPPPASERLTGFFSRPGCALAVIVAYGSEDIEHLAGTAHRSRGMHDTAGNPVRVTHAQSMLDPVDHELQLALELKP